MRFAMMTARRGFARRKAGQQGYALLLVIFVATILLVFATMAAPNIKTEGQREKEKEMIWRGRQYARAHQDLLNIGRRLGRSTPSRASALATAGAIGGTPGSPTPVGFSEERTIVTSTAGIS